MTTPGSVRSQEAQTGGQNPFDHRYVTSRRYAGKLCPRPEVNPNYTIWLAVDLQLR